uniref:Zinc finger BED domain-containing protein 4 n=2 Tax=Cacopsylla melanoneura TaxID=428564 RepID=A0A8D9E9A5_9HEMI
MDKLKAYQEQNNLPQLRLIQEVPTRWNSSLHMFDRFTTLKVPLVATMTSLNFESHLTIEDWQEIEQCRNALKKFELATVAVSSQKDVTISTLNYLMDELLDHTSSLKNVENCSDLMKSFHEELYNQCKTRFNKIVSQPGHKFLLSEATFLDPRFKKYGFGENRALYNETKKTIERRGVAILQSKYATVARPTPAQEVSTPTSPTEGQRASTSTERTQSTQESIFDNFDKKVPQMIRNSSGTANSKMIVEIDRYLNEPIIDRREDPLAWWDISKKVYPTLHEMMTKRLCIQATSVPSERIFSKGGEILTAKRSRLTNKRFAQIIFLNSNLE